MVRRKKASPELPEPDMGQDTEKPIIGLEIVERPARGSKGQWPVEREANMIAETVSTPGKAVRLAFRNIEQIVRIQMALRSRVAKHGLVMRYKQDPSAENRLICWAERIPEKAEKKEKKP